MKDKSKYLVIGTIFLIISTAIFSFAIPYYEDKISKKEQQIADILGDYQTKYTIYETAGMTIQTGERILDEINPRSEYIPITDGYVLSLKRASLYLLYPAAYGNEAPLELQNKWKRSINFDELEKEKNDLWNIVKSNTSYANITLKELDTLKSYKSMMRSLGIIFQILGLVLVTIVPNYLEEVQKKKSK